MPKLKRTFLIVPVVLVALAIPGLASAHYDPNIPGHDKRPDHIGMGQPGSTEPSPPTIAPVDDADRERKREELRMQGRAMLDELRKGRSDRSKEQRQKSCQSRKQGLETKLENLTKNAEKYQSRADEVLAKVVAYKNNKNLEVQDFDALFSTATAAQAQAKISVAALLSLKPSIDCNSDSVASDVAAFKAAAAQARIDLKTYRTAVKSLVSAVQITKGQEGQQ